MAWPPNPNKHHPSEQPTSSDQRPARPAPSGQEWRVIEKTMLASIEEQRRARL